MRFTLTATVLDSPDALALARFYQRLMGWEMRFEEPDWVILSAPDGGAGLSFQTLAQFQPQDDVRVYLDPAGHPFCLFVD